MILSNDSASRTTHPHQVFQRGYHFEVPTDTVKSHKNRYPKSPPAYEFSYNSDGYRFQLADDLADTFMKFFTLNTASLAVLHTFLSFSNFSTNRVSGSESEKPNVVIVITDDQGYGDLSCHGNPILKTPNLDELHSQAVRLKDYHVAPTCSPTRSGFLTGIGRIAPASGTPSWVARCYAKTKSPWVRSSRTMAMPQACLANGTSVIITPIVQKIADTQRSFATEVAGRPNTRLLG